MAVYQVGRSRSLIQISKPKMSNSPLCAVQPTRTAPEFDAGDILCAWLKDESYWRAAHAG
jgi:hypothetical protein